jgi:hypothetical protein
MPAAPMAISSSSQVSIVAEYICSPSAPGSYAAMQNAKLVFAADPRCDPVSSDPELSKIDQRKLYIRNLKQLRDFGMVEIEPTLKLKMEAYKKHGAPLSERVV